MSGESIVYERRGCSDELQGDCDEADGNYVKPRRAFEGRRSWVDDEVSTEMENLRSSSRASGRGRKRESGRSESAPLGRYTHRFFSEEMAACRSAYFRPVARATILTILLTWACLPIFWGSLSSSAGLTGNLEAWVINRDQARIGDSLDAAVVDAPTSGPGSLWWRLVNATHFPDEESVKEAVVSERTWLAVVVNSNATSGLSAARSVGNTSYDPSSAITVYYAQARNEVATGTYLLPAATAFLSNFTTNYATGSAQRYLAAIVANNGTVNLTALNGIAQAPQTISPGIGYSTVNLRPYTAPVAQAVTLVGQIYLCIFAFIIVMAHSAARSRIEQYLTFPSYLIIRIATPLIVYFPLSLSYALVNVAFHLPFGTHFSYGSGFMVFFGIVYLGMAALGMALEAMVTLLQPKFVPFFLVLLIIVNVSTATLPPELQSKLYGYGSGFQFWNIQQAVRTVLFDTYSHLGKNAGILIAWVLLSCGTTALFTWAVRAREVRCMLRTAATRDPEHGSSVKKSSRMRPTHEGKATYDQKGKNKSAARERWEKIQSKSSNSGSPGDEPLQRTSYRDRDRDAAVEKELAETHVDVLPVKS